MAKGTRKTKKVVGTLGNAAIPKSTLKRFNTLMKNVTAFGKLIGAV